MNDHRLLHVAPTSDSQSGGPDELREMAGLANLDLDASWGNRMCVFADVWEAERAHAAADVCMWRDCEERNADLRKRLEAAEKACRMLAGTLSTFGRYSTMHPDEVLAEFAALAGEE